MPKVRKINNLLFVGIPTNVAESMGIKEGDDLEFFNHSNNSMIVARKADLLKLLEGGSSAAAPPQGRADAKSQLGVGELDVLKKIDTVRYADRTKDKINSMMNNPEMHVLDGLLERGLVKLYRKNPAEPFKYSIPKEIYDKFLFRKNMQQGAQKAGQPQAQMPAPAQKRGVDASAAKRWETQAGPTMYAAELESRGYLVIKSEVDAASASAALEENIRQGLVLGTRAFDKKFYIGLRGFINKNAPQIMRALGEKSVKAEDVAKTVGIDEDAVKTVLYILAENGEVTEVRRGIFKIA